MNLLLVEPAELTDGTVLLADRRAVHLRSVLGVTPGVHVRAGLVGGGIGTAQVLTDDGTTIALRVSITEPAPRPLAIELVLAVPRPKVLSRAIEIAASFGVSQIALTNAWRVDKSYLDSPRLEPATLARAARLGAEQGATTHVPPITLHRRLMALLDARWPADAPTAGLRLVAHPDAPLVETVARRDGPITLAIGPEGGWIAREVETFVARGFAPVSLGSAILRVESAIAAALAQLVLLERLRER